jgi:ribosome maturation factor RimP
MTHFFVVRVMQVVEKLKALLAPILAEEKSELVDVQVKGGVGNQIIRVFVDKPGGINLDDCEAISRRFSDALDSADLIPGAYRLEVSSPGVERPLRSAADFRRNMDREVKITYAEKTDIQTVTGKIIGVTDDKVEIKKRNQASREILISTITKATIHLPW